MKKLIILFALSLIFTLSYSQNNSSQQITYIDWQLSNNGCWGCPSFYYSVSRTSTTYGYTFNVWFYSNSTYTNGMKASTYITGLYIYANGQLISKEPIWLLFKEAYSNSATSFTSSTPNPYIYLTWQNIQVY